MKTKFVLTLIALLAGTATGWAQELTSEAIQIIGGKQGKQSGRMAAPAPRVLVLTKKPCGTVKDLHFCARVEGTPRESSITLPGITVNARRGSKVIVSWQGNLYCEAAFELGPPEITPSGLRTYAREIRVSMQLQDKIRPVEFNGTGSITVAAQPGPLLLTASDEETYRTRLFSDTYPVSISRTFEGTGAVRNYRVRGLFQFIRGAHGACNVNGGAMTALVVE